MLIRVVLVLALCFMMCSEISAQNNAITSNKKGKLSGVVIDADLEEPIAYASIVVKSKRDNSILTGGVTDEKGFFEIKKIPLGALVVEVQYIGYQSFSKEITLAEKSQNIKMGAIAIQAVVEELEGVSVIAERSTIEQKIDRKVINIGKDLTTIGATAADIMINIPSVNMDQDGNIALRGNENVRVLIDGKPTNISAAQVLQQIPSTAIKKIELITNPSAKYNPEGMSGIINIVLRKNSAIGFNVNLNMGLDVGIKARYTSAADFNYNTGRLNFYGSYGNAIGRKQVLGTIFRPEDGSNETWKSDANAKSHLYKFGIDYFINDRNVLSVYTNQNSYDRKRLASTLINFSDPNTDLHRLTTSDTNNTTATYNFDYKHKFLKVGHAVELEFDYNTYKSDELADFNYKGGTFEPFIDEFNKERKSSILNIDYVNPLSETLKLELGAESRIQKTENKYISTSINLNDSAYTYNRYINSFYTTFSQHFKKWDYQLGARIENYKSEAIFNEIDKENNAFDTAVFNVYPSAFLKYTPDEENQKNAYQISFSRRVDRPNLKQITPIRAWSSARVTDIGNPKLQPQYTNSLEFNYTRRINSGSITMGFFYRKIESEITRFAFEDPEAPGKILFSYNNYKDNSAYGFELSGNYKLANWWSANGSFDLYSQTQKGETQGELIEVDNVLYSFRFSNSIKATKNLTFQVFGMYKGVNTNLQYKTGAFYFMNIGARYSFLKKKGVLSINFNDIFKTQQFSFDATRPLQQIGDFTWDSQTVYFGASYRFGGGKSKNQKRKKRDNSEKKSSSLL